MNRRDSETPNWPIYKAVIVNNHTDPDLAMEKMVIEWRCPDMLTADETIVGFLRGIHIYRSHVEIEITYEGGERNGRDSAPANGGKGG